MSIFQEFLQSYQEYGVVEEIHYPIATVSGLPTIHPEEVVVFENGELGQVWSLNENQVEILLYSKEPPSIGTQLTKTGKSPTIDLDLKMFGETINPIDLINLKFKAESKSREIDQNPPSISERSPINKPLLTGVAITDLLVPLGKGQRELIVGDHKTGKTSFALSLIKNQVDRGTIAIYASIGKKYEAIKNATQFLSNHNILDKVVLLASSSFDPPGTIYITPFMAMTIAENFRDQGKDTLLILDDLTTHAQTYREISLLAKRFPGRDSYPGDTFHRHARLLERAGNFVDKEGKTSSISCLPIAETTQNELTDYIVSNLIGITDGHILFDSNEFSKGNRPAINVRLSVTRLGKQTQSPLLQEINRKLITFISRFERTINYSHFGEELNQDVQKMLDRGEKLFSFFNQPANLNIPLNVQIVFVSMLWQDIFIGDPVIIYQFRDNLIANYHNNEAVKTLINKLASSKSFTHLLNETASAKEKLLELCQTKPS